MFCFFGTVPCPPIQIGGQGKYLAHLDCAIDAAALLFAGYRQTGPSAFATVVKSSYMDCFGVTTGMVSAWIVPDGNAASIARTEVDRRIAGNFLR